MSSATKTAPLPAACFEGDYAQRAAAYFSYLICHLRVLRARDGDAFPILSQQGLQRLEKIVDAEAPKRTLACGDCNGCNVAHSVSRTVH